MVHFMRPADSLEIRVIGIPEQLETLVDEYVVNHKISKTIQCDAYADPKFWVSDAILGAQERQQKTRHSKNKEEEIVFFKKSRVVAVVVVAVEVPKKAVHDVFVGEPGHTFHTHGGS